MNIPVRVTACCLSLLFALIIAVPRASPASTSQIAPTAATLPEPPPPVSGSLLPCPVTRPYGEVPPIMGDPTVVNGYGNDTLWTTAPMEYEGRVVFRPGGSGFVLNDGSLGIKWAWYRAVAGPLTIEGHRLDAAAPPLRADFARHNGPGVQPMYLIFSTPGCWEVTGRVNDDETVAFVILVERVGDGPNWRPDATT